MRTTPVSSFASVQEAPTPTISNRTTPVKCPPPLLLENSRLFSSVDSPTRTLRRDNKTYNNGRSSSSSSSISSSTSSSTTSFSRKPRFSSPTASPIVIQRPLVDPDINRRDFLPVGLLSSSYPSLPKKKKESDNNDTRKYYALEPTLACTVGDFDLSLVHSEGNEWMIRILPLLIACDIFKTGAPFKLLRRTLNRIVQQMMRRPIRQNNIIATIKTATTTTTTTNIVRPATKKLERSMYGTQVGGGLIKIRGIPNYGQTCFLNSVLQALASLEPFLAYLERIIQVKEDTDTLTTTTADPLTRSSSSSSFSRHVLEVLESINGGKTTATGSRRRVDPRNLLKRVGETNKQFRSKYMEQQDAQELLQALLGVVITDAQLDTTSSSDQCMLFVDDTNEDDEEETLTAVTAGDETRYSVDWSPSNSIALNGVTALNGDSMLSLSCLLRRIDEGQKSFFESKEQQQQELRSQQQNGSSGGGPAQPIAVEEDQAHQREEKKQEDFEISIPYAASEEDLVHVHRLDSTSEVINQRMDDSTLSDNTASTTNDDQSFTKESRLSTSMQIMKNTISSITPSPLSGWLGSTLRCCNCKHVRPIQNAPFLDIPVVPTSVPNYLAKAHHPAARPPPPNTCPLPACTLDQCLADFTSVERVQDVECRSCTLQKEVEHLEEEALLLRGAIDSMEKRIIQKGGDPSDQVKYLHEDLSKIEMRLFQLKTLDPDEEDASLFEQTLDNDPWLEDIEHGTVAPKKNRTLERCDAKKCLVLTRCPSILCCHVQRRYFDPTTNRMEKCVQFVEFPQELDLSPYCAYGPRASTPWAAGSQKEQDCIDRSSDMGGKMPYRLQAIIEHRGNAHSGHYVSYRRDHSGKWFRISDSNVTPISWRQVRTCQAYMLFYEAM